MFVGHFAVALAAKRAAPRVSLGVLFAACQLQDLVWPVFLLLGWERVQIAPSDNPFLHLVFTHYPWSHSLLADVGWAVLAALLYGAVSRNRRGAMIVGLVVLSHWVLDLVTHRPDLPLWPGGPEVGLGLWHYAAATAVVEAVLFAAGLWLYLSVTRGRDGVGRVGFWGLLALIWFIYLSGFAGPPPASATDLAWFAMAGWLLPFWAGWVDRHRALSLPLLLLASALALPAPAEAQRARASAERPPNVVIIMADDLGYGDVGAYGQQKIRTPRLDEMAREGTRFTQFYAGSTVCAPSRSSLMTGEHTGHTPIRGNGEVLPIGQTPLPDASVTVAEVLKARGYATGAFGKWGLGGPGSEGVPTRQGFDEFFGYLDQRRAHFYYPEFLFRGETRVPLPNQVREEPNSPGAGPAVVRGLYSHDAIMEEALSFIDRHRAEPFFLYLPFTIPHAELQAPEDAFAPYLDASGRSTFPETPFPGAHYGAQPMPRAAYAAMVTRMDRDIGRVLDRLRELGLDDNTIVLFTSDNGPSKEGGSDPDFFDSNGPFRGYKRDVYEGGIREPMIVRWPGRVPAGRVSDHVWTMWDVLPTLATLTGARAPKGIDGLDMSAALTGRGRAPRHDFLYWEFHEQGGKQAVRRGNWKAVRLNLTKDPAAPVELYDLASDPGETRDLAAQHPAIARQMHALMLRARTPSTLFPSLNDVR